MAANEENITVFSATYNNDRKDKTYQEVVRAHDHAAIIQVMGFCVVTRKQSPGNNKQKTSELKADDSKTNK